MTDRSTEDVPSPREALSSRTDLGTKDAVCPEHGKFVSKGFRLAAWKREIWSDGSTEWVHPEKCPTGAPPPSLPESRA